MNAVDVLMKECQERGITFKLNAEGQLCYNAPKGSMSQAVLNSLKARRADIARRLGLKVVPPKPVDPGPTYDLGGPDCWPMSWGRRPN